MFKIGPNIWTDTARILRMQFKRRTLICQIMSRPRRLLFSWELEVQELNVFGLNKDLRLNAEVFVYTHIVFDLLCLLRIIPSGFDSRN